ncbi:MAG: phytoene desaturase family protein [Flammeovirgaceae bacterium]
MNNTYDACVIGSGMAGLTTACLLAKQGLKVAVLEQNYLPGGCTSSYWRKGFVFESGATTLVGLDEHMPLRYLLDELDIQLDAVQLKLPMKVWLADGSFIHKYQEMDAWIREAERIFGEPNQRKFWEFCKKVSDFVWETSLKQTAFPPTNFSDLWLAVQRSSIKQVKMARYALKSMESLLRQYNLLENQRFVDFVNEQLMITAQNKIEEVNVLFGATALCYTNYGNYYMNGGLINLVNPLLNYLEANQSILHTRTLVERVEQEGDLYGIYTRKQGKFYSKYLISGIPINNTVQLFNGEIQEKYTNHLLESTQLNSAFQMGIGFRNSRNISFDCIHHQIHLKEPLPEIGSDSIFLSLSHPDDRSRADEAGSMVASISTHVPNPAYTFIEDKTEIESKIIAELVKLGFFLEEDIVYRHSSTPKSWQKWTLREWGFVGGYPQFMHIKPWQMLDARLDGKRAYICGDTTYPGQGIPGTVLSGIIAFEKLKNDHL